MVATARTDAPPDPALVRSARRTLTALSRTYPDARCELDFRSPFELLVATVLSAQCTDRRVNAVTPRLFAEYPSATSLAAADREHLESVIRPTGFFRAKAGSLLALSQAICDRYAGQVPATMAELVTLPGVGRKTANVVLGDAFGVPGITVDTHVVRLSHRLGWTGEKDPDRIEAALGALLPRTRWTQASHVLIFHGRRCCHARTPACGACPVARTCPSFGAGPTDPVAAARLLRTEGAA